MRHNLQSILDELRHTQFQSPAQLAEYQRRLLEPLVRHARAHVPFYRESGRLDVLFWSDGSIDWDRWREIPPLTRAEVQQNGERLRSEALPQDHGPSAPYSTSGSTAEPVKVWHSRLSNPIVRAAVAMRNVERHGIDPDLRVANLYPFRPDDFDIGGARRHVGGPDKYTEFGLIGERFDIADTRPFGELIEELAAIRPKLLRAQTVTLEMLCAFDQERRLADLGLAAVFAVGEHFPEDARRDVADHLGAWIIEAYGSVECGRMAHSCAVCGRFHVEAETVFLEVIGDDGTPASPGQTGWVIATPLYNYAMPLIRYDHADRAMVGAPDECTTTLPVLDQVLGKERTVFTFPGGKAIRPVVPSEALIEFLGTQSFQVAQVAEDRCVVRFVPGTLAHADMRFDEMTRLLRTMWWSGLQVDYRAMDSIPRRSAHGKLAAYVREIADVEPRVARMRSGQNLERPKGC